jgi:hypothetical protein
MASMLKPKYHAATYGSLEKQFRTIKRDSELMIAATEDRPIKPEPVSPEDLGQMSFGTSFHSRNRPSASSSRISDGGKYLRPNARILC